MSRWWWTQRKEGLSRPLRRKAEQKSPGFVSLLGHLEIGYSRPRSLFLLALEGLPAGCSRQQRCKVWNLDIIKHSLL